MENQTIDSSHEEASFPVRIKEELPSEEESCDNDRMNKIHKLDWEDHSCFIMKNLATLYKDNLFVDCTLKIQGQNVNAHKNVLAAISPYFEHMFRGEPQEKHFTLEDIEYKDFKLVLDFIYLGRAEVPSEELQAFLNVIDYLQLQFSCNLKPHCDVMEVDIEKKLKGENSICQDHVTKNREGSCVYVSESVPEDLSEQAEEKPEGNEPDPLAHASSREDFCNDVTIKTEKEDDGEYPDLMNYSDEDYEEEEEDDESDEEVLGNRSDNVSYGDAVRSGARVSEDIVSEQILPGSIEDRIRVLHNDRAIYSVGCVDMRKKVLNAKMGIGDEGTGEAVRADKALPVTEIASNAGTGSAPMNANLGSFSWTSVSKVFDSASSLINPSREQLPPPPPPEPETQTQTHVVLVPRKRIRKNIYACEICDKKFNQRSNLTRHMVVHDEKTPLACDTCGRVFYRHNNLVTHRQVHLSQKPFPCEACGKQFMKQTRLAKHLHFCYGGKTIACKVCGKTFTKRSNLHSHSRVHTGEKPFSCKECGKAFGFSSSLLSHMRTHTGEKPFACPECGLAFSERGTLRKHLRTHSGEKPYACDACGKAFTALGNLRTHMRTHTGEKPFTCDDCGVAFSDCSTLRRHRQTHTQGTGDKDKE